MVQDNQHQQQHHSHHYHHSMHPNIPSQYAGPGSGSAPPPFRGAVSQRGRSRGRRTTPSNNNNTSSSSSGMMAGFVDRVMSPFVQCWQPPLNSCISSTTTPLVTPMANRRGVVSPHHHHPAAAPIRTPIPSSSLDPSPPLPAAPLETPHHRRTSTMMEESIDIPSQVDVLLGRGGNSNRHNVYFRQLVAANKPYYANLTKKQKMLVSRNIVEVVHQAGGHFLSKDPISGLWKDVGLPRSLEKASQALREKSNESSAMDDDTTVQEPKQQSPQEQSAEVPKLDPRTVAAPPLVIPPHLKDIYQPKSVVHVPVSQEKQTPSLSSGERSGGWIAEFPPGPFVEPRTAMEQQQGSRRTPYQQQPTPSFHPALSSSQVSSSSRSNDDGFNLPAPHRGAFPFHARHMPRDSSDIRRASSTVQPAEATTPGTTTSTLSSGSSSWKASFGPPTSPIVSRNWVPFPHTNSTSSNKHSPDRGSSVSVPSVATTCATSSTTTVVAHHSPPRSDLRFVASDRKRQRMHIHNNDDDEMEGHEQELEDCNDSGKPFSLQDTSLPEGSEYLPPSEMGKLSLTDRVVGAPVAMTTTTTTTMEQLEQRETNHHGGDLQSPSTVCLPRARRNVGGAAISRDGHQGASASEKDGMAGLAALSTAAFLRMDESG